MKRIWKILAVLLAVADLLIALIYMDGYIAVSGGWIPDPLNLHPYAVATFIERNWASLLLIAGVTIILNSIFIIAALCRKNKNNQ